MRDAVDDSVGVPRTSPDATPPSASRRTCPLAAEVIDLLFKRLQDRLTLVRRRVARHRAFSWVSWWATNLADLYWPIQVG
jgi:hypothetical protein